MQIDWSPRKRPCIAVGPSSILSKGICSVFTSGNFGKDVAVEYPEHLHFDALVSSILRFLYIACFCVADFSCLFVSLSSVYYMLSCRLFHLLLGFAEISRLQSYDGDDCIIELFRFFSPVDCIGR